MATIQLKRGLSTNLEAAKATLEVGEPVFVTDTGKVYVYDGENLVPINAALGTAADKDVGTEAGNVVGVGEDGKIDLSLLPAIAITTPYPVDSEVAMLALDAETGDIAIRSDIRKTFVLKQAPASTLENWLELLTPTDSVASVAGKTGAVTLEKADVGLEHVDNTADVDKPISTAVQEALDLKAPLDSPALAGTPTAPTAKTSTNNTQVATTVFVKAQGYLTADSVIDGGTF